MISAAGWPVHPRACGEHCAACGPMPSKAGSSPRLRGTLMYLLIRQEIHRFIPAPAGNTRRSGRGTHPAAVHPRACGEHGSPWPSSSGTPGSSPRLRGTPAALDFREQASRFIPAPAGNTLRPVEGQPPRAVHPRACGEHPSVTAALPPVAGSSPRLRGTPRRTAMSAEPPRFIPAPAGNTVICLQSASSTPVHPRACGEHIVDCIIHSNLLGSSPRLRGTRGKWRAATRRDRFIPAPAGNTRAS